MPFLSGTVIHCAARHGNFAAIIGALRLARETGQQLTTKNRGHYYQGECCTQWRGQRRSPRQPSARVGGHHGQRTFKTTWRR